MFNRFRDRLTGGLRINRLLEADVAQSEWRPEQLRAPTLPNPDRSRERRSEPRFAARGACDVAVIAPENAFSVRGEVCDLSRSGIGLLLPCAVTPGHQVTIRTGRLVIFGIVLHAVPMGNGTYRTGVRLREVFELENAPPAL